MAIIKKTTNNKCQRGYGEKGIVMHCWWECELVQPLWRTAWKFLQKQKHNYHMMCNPTPRHIYGENQKSEIHIYLNVHCSTINNSQDMEAT